MPPPVFSRRTLLVGGGAGIGLVVAYALWPREYAPNLAVAPGEALINAFLKIGRDGRVVVAVPQAELGQGVFTSLPQILADELGADWRTVSVEPAPLSPIYANRLLAADLATSELPSWAEGIGRWAAREYATRTALMITGGSTSVRAFEPALRQAGAAARALLSMAAAQRWGIDWEELDTQAGFVVHGRERLPFAELAEAAAGFAPPLNLPARGGTGNRLTGQNLPRLDVPAKVDGSLRFAGDVRLPDMVFASARSGAGRLEIGGREAAQRIPGMLGLVEREGWVAAAATNWWAADRAVRTLRLGDTGPPPDSKRTEAALIAALAGGGSDRVHERGDLQKTAIGVPHRAIYAVGPAPNAPPETLTATARLTGDRVEIWAPTQAPGLARAAAARTAGLDAARVTIYPMPIGGGYGRKLETIAIEQAVVVAQALKRPVQLTWSRAEETVRDTFRPPARAQLDAWLRPGGRIAAWHARIAAPATTAQVIGRLRTGRAGPASLRGPPAVDGAVPPYAIPAIAVDHHPADVGLTTGIWRSGAHSYTAFFTETFIDELARVATIEPLSFRMGLLTGNARLARVLSTAAALGGWDGGLSGSRLGIAAHSAFGSHAALLVAVSLGENRRIRVERAVCAVDCGRIVNPGIVRQLVEGGILHGIAGATGTPVRFDEGRPNVRSLRDLALPTLAESPEIVVEIIASQEPPGGVTELAVPPVAPAIGNALYALTGQRLRSLPFDLGAA